MKTPELKDTININVRHALNEDIGTGDITAALIPEQQQAIARLICREQAVICGRPWFDEVFRQIDPEVTIEWHIKEGEQVAADQLLVTLTGSARSLLTGERAAMNFLQTLSGTATRCHHYLNLLKDTQVKLLDTRKTLPGLRLAQKYAVAQGGCHNHRTGLFDAFLIKENHIAACGGIHQAVETAKDMAPGKPVEIEVENLDEFHQARDAGADRIMLDNFALDLLQQTVELNKTLTGNRPELEASGNITENTLPHIAATGVDYISIGALTKHCEAVDLSMRLTEIAD
ncbi:carboxylating nicotinate-nucleotide diphosphorylase [Endozoicomonas gorgoniicola]|uniref:nicotinate-nucleotide diphosphorylase (carboxylating) n=1 Tax=Endozoicomonas gorgoniicola TaxID=1234144 RepID=A0ABT3MZE4_9GAMM|nr:carboxylating nicotinate-nucleotide diphosphorylase [Endozoicomonas gorgoniicola]MCW7554369.1 carboxylating nicotinate-nucleotide diphosphorylase [Endozoicomonas gorgoniicola]